MFDYMSRLIIGLFVAGIVLVGGFIAANIFFMGSTQSNLEEMATQSQIESCEQGINSAVQFSETGETLTIPESCFAEGEPLIPSLEGAEPGDEIVVTDERYELAE